MKNDSFPLMRAGAAGSVEIDAETDSLWKVESKPAGPLWNVCASQQQTSADEITVCVANTMVAV